MSVGAGPQTVDAAAGECAAALSAVIAAGSDAGPTSGVATAAGLHDDLGWALATVLRSYLRTFDRVLEDLPGGARGYRLLTSVARDCPRSQLVLAQHVGLDRTVVTYLLDDLTTAGLVERQADPDDRRTRRVVVTDAGRLRLAELEAVLLRVENHVLGDLPPEDSRRFRDLLQRVALGIRERDSDDLTCGEVPALTDC